jgi:hypothetical protein
MRFSSEKEFDVIRDRNIVWKPNQPAHATRCDNCRNADTRTTGEASPEWRDCIRYGFMTYTHAVCSDHQPIIQESAA